MSVVTAPTDSLYKFMAIAGLVLVASPWFIVLPEYRSTMTRMFAARRELLAIQRQMNASNGRMTDLSVRVADLVARPPSDEIGAIARQLMEEGRRLRAEEEALRLDDTAVTAEEVAQLSKDTVQLLYGGIIVSALGFTTALNGFLLWYRRIQRYEDLIMASRLARETQVSAPPTTDTSASPPPKDEAR
ncbi:MAG: hypothetical protein HOP16_04170 [Acidobacteria bacterium]|nr:hypothetical protein [Acidobacteriota bacterium]